MPTFQERLTAILGRKKPVRGTDYPTTATITSTTAASNLTDLIKRFNANQHDIHDSLSELKTEVDTKTATTITLAPSAINLPADAVNNVTLEVNNLTVLPDGASAFLNDYNSITDTDKIAIQKGEDGGLITLAEFKQAAGLSDGNQFSSDYTTITDTDKIAIQKGEDGGLISFADLKNAVLSDNANQQSEFTVDVITVNDTDKVALKSGETGSLVLFSDFKSALQIPTFSATNTVIGDADLVMIEKAGNKGVISFANLKTALSSGGSQSQTPIITYHRFREMGGYTNDGFYFMCHNPVAGFIKKWVITGNSGVGTAALYVNDSPASGYKNLNFSSNSYQAVITASSIAVPTAFNSKIQVHLADLSSGFSDLTLQLEWSLS